MIFPSQIQRLKDFRIMGASSDLMELIAITRWLWHTEYVGETGDDVDQARQIYVERIMPVIESTDYFVDEHPEHRLTLNRLIAFSSLASQFSPGYANKHFLEIKLKGIPDDWAENAGY